MAEEPNTIFFAPSTVRTPADARRPPLSQRSVSAPRDEASSVAAPSVTTRTTSGLGGKSPGRKTGWNTLPSPGSTNRVPAVATLSAVSGMFDAL